LLIIEMGKLTNYLESGRWTKSENPVILCVIQHRQNPIESTNIMKVREVIDVTKEY
jgi:hypothetical protein